MSSGAECPLLAHSGLLEQPHRMSAFKGKPDAFSRDLLSPLMTQSRRARLWLDGVAEWTVRMRRGNFPTAFMVADTAGGKAVSRRQT